MKEKPKSGLLTSFEEIDAYEPELTGLELLIKKVKNAPINTVFPDPTEAEIFSVHPLNQGELLAAFPMETDFPPEIDHLPRAAHRKPVSRVYKGVVYMAEHEAKFAEFLDAMGFTWKYEKDKWYSFLVSNWRESDNQKPEKVFILALPLMVNETLKELDKYKSNNVMFFDFEQVDWYYSYQKETGDWGYFQLPTYDIDYDDEIEVKFRNNISILDCF